MNTDLTEINRNSNGKKFIEDVKNDVHDLDISNQPLTSSIWGRRIKDKWYKELWWWILERFSK